MTDELAEVLFDMQGMLEVRADRPEGLVRTFPRFHGLCLVAAMKASWPTWEPVPVGLFGMVDADTVRRAWLPAAQRVWEHRHAGHPWPVVLRPDLRCASDKTRIRTLPREPHERETRTVHEPAPLVEIKPFLFVRSAGIDVRGFVAVLEDAVEHNVGIIVAPHVPNTRPAWEGGVDDPRTWPRDVYFPEIDTK